MIRWLAIAVLVGGCGGDCVEGVCADYDVTAKHPGPCASVPKATGCTFMYDNDGHIAHATCGADDAVWTWMPNGMAKTIDVGSTKWIFGQQITVAGATMQTYDPALFQFLPLVGDEVSRPAAVLGLVKDGATTYTWTRAAGQWTRMSSAGEAKVFEVDDTNRILGYDTFHFRYDGAHLVEWSDDAAGTVDSYRYDRGGNVAVHERAGKLEVFDYGCW